MGVNRYPSYKPSGVPWIGDVPDHWRIIPGRNLYVEKKVPNRGLKETQVLSLSYGKIRIRGEEELHGLVPASFESYQMIEPGDIICRPTDLQNDWNSLRFGLSPHKGIITSAYICFKTKPGIDRRYGHLLFHTYDLKKVFYGLGSGLRQNLDWKDFKHLPCLQPATLDEQSAIVRFLDHADEQIQRYIAAKERLIALLAEERQALVHQAVTRGLNPGAKLKDSGVEWLGEVPEHWGVQKLKTVCGMKSGEGITAFSIESEGKYPVYGGNGLRGYASEFTHDGDYILIGRQGALCGNVHVARGQFWASEHAVVTTVYPDHILEWLSALLEIMNLNQYSIAAAQPGLAVERVMNLWIPVPPQKEQVNIAGGLEGQTKGIYNAMAQTRRQIDLMNEYRTRLIADVVTGQLDVREAAAQLQESP